MDVILTTSSSAQILSHLIDIWHSILNDILCHLLFCYLIIIIDFWQEISILVKMLKILKCKIKTFWTSFFFFKVNHFKITINQTFIFSIFKKLNFFNLDVRLCWLKIFSHLINYWCFGKCRCHFFVSITKIFIFVFTLYIFIRCAWNRQSCKRHWVAVSNQNSSCQIIMQKFVSLILGFTYLEPKKKSTKIINET